MYDNFILVHRDDEAISLPPMAVFLIIVAVWNYTLVRDRKSLFSTDVPGTWWNITGVLPYTQYSVQVEASNTAGSVLSNIVSSITDPVPSPNHLHAPLPCLPAPPRSAQPSPAQPRPTSPCPILPSLCFP